MASEDLEHTTQVVSNAFVLFRGTYLPVTCLLRSGLVYWYTDVKGKSLFCNNLFYSVLFRSHCGRHPIQISQAQSRDVKPRHFVPGRFSLCLQWDFYPLLFCSAQSVWIRFSTQD